VSEAVKEFFGNASGYRSGIRIIVARIAPLNANVAIIQYLDLDLILPPDSNIESSNISDLFPERESYLP
jgi:hypothetical protein